MREITAENAADYLRESGRVPEGLRVEARELGGGVSNVVIRVDVEGREPIVLKQSRERLRTRAEWLSRLDRIWVEQAAIDVLGQILPEGNVPALLFDDRENFLFAMSCAPDDAVTWKARLMAGEADGATAAEAGRILGTVHAEAAGHPALGSPLFADMAIFDGLRLDPYYRRIAAVHPDLAPGLGRLIASALDSARRTLVLGDFSPKNILVHGKGLTVVDFETAHAGDPAFDLGFFLSHLLLKAFRSAPLQTTYLDLTYRFWENYALRSDPGGDIVTRANEHAAACVLARLDGKSPVDYRDQLDVVAVRRFAREALRAVPPDWDGLIQLAAREMQQSHPRLSDLPQP